jgi:hypothetical protein
LFTYEHPFVAHFREYILTFLHKSLSSLLNGYQINCWHSNCSLQETEIHHCSSILSIHYETPPLLAPAVPNPPLDEDEVDAEDLLLELEEEELLVSVLLPVLELEPPEDDVEDLAVFAAPPPPEELLSSFFGISCIVVPLGVYFLIRSDLCDAVSCDGLLLETYLPAPES